MFIGNSFSLDTMNKLYDLLGDTYTLGLLYIPGSDFNRHYTAISNNEDIYQFMKWDKDGYQYYSQKTSDFGFNYADWEMVYINQVSGKAGFINTYGNDMKKLMNLINSKGGKRFDYGMIMAWAYASNSTLSQFSAYDRDQLKMYSMISSTVKDVYYEVNDIIKVLPTGTVIQNARQTPLINIGNELTRDTQHLEEEKARQIASLTAYAFITNNTIDNMNNGVFTEEEFTHVKDSIHKTIDKPFTITI